MKIENVELLITIIGGIAFLLSLIGILFKREINTGAGTQQVDVFGKVTLNVNSVIMLMLITGVVTVLPLSLRYFKTDLRQYMPVSEVERDYTLKTDVEKNYIPKSELKLIISGTVKRNSEVVSDARVSIEQDDGQIIKDKIPIDPSLGFFSVDIENIKLNGFYLLKAKASAEEVAVPVHVSRHYVPLELPKE